MPEDETPCHLPIREVARILDEQVANMLRPEAHDDGLSPDVDRRHPTVGALEFQQVPEEVAPIRNDASEQRQSSRAIRQAGVSPHVESSNPAPVSSRSFS